jgi:hypothetical protein
MMEERGKRKEERGWMMDDGVKKGLHGWYSTYIALVQHL